MRTKKGHTLRYPAVIPFNSHCFFLLMEMQGSKTTSDKYAGKLSPFRWIALIRASA